MAAKHDKNPSSELIRSWANVIRDNLRLTGETGKDNENPHLQTAAIRLLQHEGDLRWCFKTSRYIPTTQTTSAERMHTARTGGIRRRSAAGLGA